MDDNATKTVKIERNLPLTLGNSKGLIPVCLILLVVLTTPGCDSGTAGGDPVDVATLSITTLETTMAQGVTRKIIIQARDADGNSVSADPVWSSSDESIISISQDGSATAIARGMATLTATVQDLTDSIELNVLDLDGTWQATVSDPSSPGGVNVITFVLNQTALTVTGTYSNLSGFPPITDMKTAQITADLIIGINSSTLKLTFRVESAPCNLIWEVTSLITRNSEGELVLRPSSETAPYTSETCNISGNLRVAEVIWQDPAGARRGF